MEDALNPISTKLRPITDSNAPLLQKRANQQHSGRNLHPGQSFEQAAWNRPRSRPLMNSKINTFRSYLALDLMSIALGR
jgi:hypothetical protein